VGRDPEYLAFMRRVAQARAGEDARGIDEHRDAFRRNVARLPRAPMAAVRDLSVPGGDGPLRARLLVPPDATDDALVYVHGGGWCLGDLDGWEPVARVIAQATHARVLEIEHRQAPEHPFPKPLDDVRAALRWAIEHADLLGARRVGAVGDSSGVNLVAAAARHVDGLALQALIYPALDLARPLEPIDDPDGIVKPAGGREVRDRYLAGADPTDPDASPLLAADFEGLPPTVICVAEYDVLRQQGLDYAQRLQAADVPVTLVDAHGLDHAFFAWGAFARRPAEAIAEFGEAVRAASQFGRGPRLHGHVAAPAPPNEKRHGPEPPGVLSAT
jgi:acetyl esterase